MVQVATRYEQEKITINGESFAGLNSHGFTGVLEEHKSFSHESFALSSTYKRPGLALQK